MAILDYNKAIEIDPFDADHGFNRAVAEYRLRAYDSAIADFTKALELNPTNTVWGSSAYVDLGNSRDLTGDSMGAISDYSKAIQLDPSNASAYYNRGVAKGGTGDKKGQCEDYKNALNLGYVAIAQWLKTEKGAWCHNM